MIRITVKEGNGYFCHCCRQTSISTEDCMSMEEAIKYCTDIEFKAKELKEDIKIVGVSIVRDINIKIDESLYAQKKEEHNKKKEQERQKAEAEEKARKLALLKSLQKEMGEGA